MLCSAWDPVIPSEIGDWSRTLRLRAIQSRIGPGMITLERALALISAGEEEARRQDLALAFAVVDDGGHLVALHRMDGAPWIAPEVATGKAWTAAAYRAPSAAQGDKMKDLHAFSRLDQRRDARPVHAPDRRPADHRRRHRDRRDGRERRHRPAGRGRRAGGAVMSARPHPHVD